MSWLASTRERVKIRVVSKKSLLVKVYGRVQGVNFRSSAHSVARSLGLTGYAKNNPDGSVEVKAVGAESELAKFLEWAQRGSSLSLVEKFEYEWGPYEKSYPEFVVVRSGNFLTDQIRAFRNLGRSIVLPKNTRIPKHVAIIPDGNRRWAKERGLPASAGHRESSNRFTELAEAAREAGIRSVTVWGFSTENWDRSPKEKKELFKIFDLTLKKIEKESAKHQIRFRHLGRKDRLPQEILSQIERLEKRTAKYNKYQINVALDYGGRDEIVRGVNKALQNGSEPVTEESFSKLLDTQGLPDPDLIIRTSGEQRLSGIFPWQGVYSELYFTPLHFPDFDKNELRLALLDYSNRQRRYGR